MANRENTFQSELVKDMKAAGMHAFKASHQYSTGVLDIWCRSSKIGCWIECKFFKADDTFRTKKISLTTPQFAFARKEIQAGGTAVKIIGYVRSGEINRHGLFICSAQVQHTQITIGELNDLNDSGHFIKVRGHPWPASLIIDHIAFREEISATSS